MSKTSINSDKKMSQLPGWLWPNSNFVSPLYKRIWEAVKEDCCKINSMCDDVLVDTNKIFPLLLTSQLSTEVLGYIWSLANQRYAGQLTEQELYIVLALVALAQASYPFNSLEVLYYVQTPPIPNLNLSVFDVNIEESEIQLHVSQSSSFSVANKRYGNLATSTNTSINLSSYINIFPCNKNYSNNFKDLKFSSAHLSSHNTNLIYEEQNAYNQSNMKHKLLTYSTESSDDFSDFQSAPINNIPIIPNLWDLKQGSAIGSRLANHNLGVKKLNDKVKKSNVSKYNNHNSTHNIIASHSTLYNKEIQSNECISEIFPKCTVKNQEKTVVLKDTAIRNNDSIEIVMLNKKDFIHSSERRFINKIDLRSKSSCTNNISTIYNSSSPGMKKDEVKQDLMNLQTTEDKYSALRTMVNQISNLPSLKSNLKPHTTLAADDFGEFISAINLEPSSEIENSITINSIDLLNDFDLNSGNIIDTDSKYNPLLIQKNSDIFNNPILDNIVDKHTSEGVNMLIDTGWLKLFDMYIFKLIY
jgi:hypothetical protein